MAKKSDGLGGYRVGGGGGAWGVEHTRLAYLLNYTLLIYIYILVHIYTTVDI